MKYPLAPFTRRSRRTGFTLVELLTVIAIIAILAGILVPTVGTAIKKVKESKTRVQLNNMVEMCVQYKQVYKYWPTFGPPQLNQDTVFRLTEHRPDFVQIMTGNPSTPDIKYNKQKIAFATFNDADLSPDPANSSPIDAFGNDDLYLVFNTNLAKPHQIDPGTVNDLSFNPIEGGQPTSMAPQQDPQVPITQDCVALSPGAGLSNYDVIVTWDVVAAGTVAGQ